MRHSSLSTYLAPCFVSALLASLAQAALPVDPVADAARALEVAKLEYRLFRQVEYPREDRRLAAQIKLTRAEVESFRRRVREYKQFDRFQTGKPLFVTLENARLHLLEAELRLRDLKAELSALRRFRSDRCRLLELKVQRAHAQLVRLQAERIALADTAS